MAAGSKAHGKYADLFGWACNANKTIMMVNREVDENGVLVREGIRR